MPSSYLKRRNDFRAKTAAADAIVDPTIGGYDNVQDVLEVFADNIDGIGGTITRYAAQTLLDPDVSGYGNVQSAIEQLSSFAGGQPLAENVMLDPSVGGADDVQEFAQATRTELDTLGASLLDASAAAQLAADEAEASALEAADFADSSAANASLAADYAGADVDTDLPNGGVSCAVSVDRANSIALGSRLITTRSNDQNETFDVSSLSKLTRMLNATSKTITIPPGINQGGDGQAFAVYLKEAAGNVVFVAEASGLDLRAPTLTANANGLRREKDLATTTTVAKTILVPNPTTGKLVIIVGGLPNFSPVTTTAVVTASGGLTVNAVAGFPASTFQVFDAFFGVWEIVLTNWTAGNITVTAVVGPTLNAAHLALFVLEGTDAVAATVVRSAVGAPAATRSVTIVGALARSRILALAIQRGGVGTVNFASFGAGMSAVAAGTSSTQPNTLTSEDQAFKNWAYATGQGSPGADSDFVVTANFDNALNEVALCAVHYPPVVEVGASAVTLNATGGRTTITEAFGEATLKFSSDGNTVYLNIPKP